MKSHNSWSGSNFGNSLKFFQKVLIQSGPAATASYTLVISIIFFTTLGWMVDSRKGSSPYGILLGIGIGLVIGFYHLAKTIWYNKK